MDTVWLILASVAGVSLISLIGALGVAANEARLRKVLLYMVSFSAGALFGDTFLHLLPEAIESGKSTLTISGGILLGIVVFFILEKIVNWHHCHTVGEHEHTKSLGVTNLIGDGIHNLVDGAVIAGSFLVSVPLGIATTFAVALHEIPQEISDFGVLLHAGYSRITALGLNFLSALAAFVGAALVLVLQEVYAGLEIGLISFTMGGFIYIAGSDLIPELHKESNLWQSSMQLFFILLGIGVMAGLLLLE